METKQKIILSEQEQRQRMLDWCSRGGKASKRNHITPIYILNVKTQEVKKFDSRVKCKEFLKISDNTMKKFVRGERTRISNQWNIIRK